MSKKDLGSFGKAKKGRIRTEVRLAKTEELIKLIMDNATPRDANHGAYQIDSEIYDELETYYIKYLMKS